MWEHRGTIFRFFSCIVFLVLSPSVSYLKIWNLSIDAPGTSSYREERFFQEKPRNLVR